MLDMRLLLPCLALLTALPAAHAQQQRGPSMSMPLTTALLKTMRCLKGADTPADFGACHADMNAAEDLMRSPDETSAYRTVARYAAARIRFNEARASALEDIKAQWQLAHPNPDTEDWASLEKLTKAELSKPSNMTLFGAEDRCETAIDTILRTQRMRPVADCKVFFGSDPSSR